MGTVSPSWIAAGALTFAAAYLLYPALQAANVAEFHALPLATPLILFALLAAQRRRWGWFTLAALLVGQCTGRHRVAGHDAGLLRAGHRRADLVARPQDRRRARFRGRVADRAGRAGGGRWVWPGSTSRPSSSFRPMPRKPTDWANCPYVARYGALGSSFNDVVTQHGHPTRSGAANHRRAAATALSVRPPGALRIPVAGRPGDSVAGRAAAAGQSAERVSVPIQRSAALLRAAGGLRRRCCHRRRTTRALVGTVGGCRPAQPPHLAGAPQAGAADRVPVWSGALAARSPLDSRLSATISSITGPVRPSTTDCWRASRRRYPPMRRCRPCRRCIRT